MRAGAAIYYGGLRVLGATAVRRRLQDAGLILCYHNIVSGEDEQVGDPGLHLPRERFERQVRWLRDHYDVLPLRELIGRLASGAAVRSAAAITFDDAYAGVFEHAVPLLRTLRIPATIFVVTGAAAGAVEFWWDHRDVVASEMPARRERWLKDLRGDGSAIVSELHAPVAVPLPPSYRPADWATIRAHLVDGIDIGGHSATHRALPTLGGEELEYEIVASRSAIHHATGKWPELFAYPYGLSDHRVREVVRRAGYHAAVSLDAGLNRASADPWCLRRVNVPAGISDAAFEAWTAGFPSRGSH